MGDPRLTICVPAYNEAGTLADVLDSLEALSLPVPFEVVVVDDGSRDGTARQLEKGLAKNPRLRVFTHGENRGKSAALSTAIRAARGDWIAIQDADLEYDPAEYARLLGPLMRGEADAVYGSRYLPASRRDAPTRLHTLANRFLTTLSNLFTGLRLTDMETCHKLFQKSHIGEMPFRAQRFAVEPEITARLARSGARVLELPVAYRPRNRGQGKKIGFRDGLEAVLWIIRMGWGG